MNKRKTLSAKSIEMVHLFGIPHTERVFFYSKCSLEYISASEIQFRIVIIK